MLKEKHQRIRQPWLTRCLIACGAIGPLLFIIVFLIEGATRSNYNAWYNFVSDLSMGHQGGEQVGNFLVCGVCMLCFAVGLRRVLRSARVLF
jgi:hypothetical membrane protein